MIAASVPALVDAALRSPAGGPDLTVAAGPARVGVSCANAGVAGWIQRYLDGFWTVAPAPARHAPIHIVSRLDGPLTAELIRLGARGQPATLYLGAAGRRVDTGSVLLVTDAGLALARPAGADRALVVAADADTLGLATLRLTRQLTDAALRQAGWLLLHAAGAVRGGNAVLALGGKGAGKTAAALALATRRGWRVLANDRAWVRPQAGAAPERRGAVEVLPWPSSLNIGLGLVQALGWGSRLHERYRAGADPPYRQHPDVTAALRAGRFQPVLAPDGRERKCQLYPADLPASFGVELGTGGRLAALVRPQVNLRDQQPAVERWPAIDPGAPGGGPPAAAVSSAPDGGAHAVAEGGAPARVVDGWREGAAGAPGPADGRAPGPADGGAPGPADGRAPGPADGGAPGPADGGAPALDRSDLIPAPGQPDHFPDLLGFVAPAAPALPILAAVSAAVPGWQVRLGRDLDAAAALLERIASADAAR